MTEPGWYHAAGDPPASTRYWDGSRWVGEPRRTVSVEPSTVSSATSNAGSERSNGIMYYATPSSDLDLGDVATRVTLRDLGANRSYAQSPFSATKASVNVTPRRPLPEGLKSLAILVCVLKAIPLAGMAFGIVTVVNDASIAGRFLRRYAPPGIDFDTGRTTAVVVMLVIVLMTAGLLFSQGRSAIDDRADGLFLAAAALLLIDLFGAVDQWAALASGQSAGPTMLATLSLVLQGWLTAWAATRASRS